MTVRDEILEKSDFLINILHLAKSSKKIFNSPTDRLLTNAIAMPVVVYVDSIKDIADKEKNSNQTKLYAANDGYLLVYGGGTIKFPPQIENSETNKISAGYLCVAYIRLYKMLESLISDNTMLKLENEVLNKKLVEIVENKTNGVIE